PGTTPGSSPGVSPGVSPSPKSSPKPPPPPAPHRTVFAFSASGNPSSVIASLPKVVTGVSWIVAWRDIEPTGPVSGVHKYNWGRIDAALAAASGSGRTSMVRVIAGGMSPSWVQPNVTFTYKPNGP